MWHSRPPQDPPPFMANTILNFHFDYLNPSLIGDAKSPRIGDPKELFKRFNKIIRKVKVFASNVF